MRTFMRWGLYVAFAAILLWIVVTILGVAHKTGLF